MSHAFLDNLLSSIAEQGRRLIQKAPQPRPPEKESMAELCEAILSERGESSGIVRAQVVLELYRTLDKPGRAAFFEMLASRFRSDHARIATAIEAYASAPTDANAIRLHEAAEPRRQELIRRLNRSPRGTASLVAMREDLIELLKSHPTLAAVDHDFGHLLSSWFNRGFLVLKRIDWNTSAAILEKIIRYEAVHEIRSWEDLRRRIEPSDRRCYAFFHPAMLDEPLIFVEVALTKGSPDAIAPILADARPVLAEREADTATFYSISNCQKGLRGVSFGNFLIKQVVEELKRDLPWLATFVTLSPAPGFASWLDGLLASGASGVLSDDRRKLLRVALAEPGWHESRGRSAELEQILMPLAAHYFLRVKAPDGAPVDPVARFHLGNGARLERIDWLGDVSPRGLRQAAGLMVNYRYDLAHIEANHEAFARERKVAASSAVHRLLTAA